MAKKKYNVISLFSGAMGLDLGLEATGRFRVVACIESEPSFCDTIRANKRAGHLYRGLKLYDQDIRHVDPKRVLRDVGLKVGQVDLIVGGPPCQSFSTAGKRRTTQDPRGSLLWQYLRFVQAMRPRFFVMENVRGLLSAALLHRPIAERPQKGGPPLSPEELPGSVVRRFAEELQSLAGASYHMDCFEVNAVNYGAPQLRERAIFVGNRFNAVIDFPDPTHGRTDDGSQPTLFEGQGNTIRPWRTLREAIGDLRETDPAIMDFSPRKKRFLTMVPPGSNWRSLPVRTQQESMGSAWHAKGGRSGWWRRLTFDLPCPTLMTMPNHASTALCHPSETRALTLREYARIQEFPDAWEFRGTVPQMYAQVGNAVPVRLGTVTGEIVARELDALRARRWQKYRPKPDSYRVVYVQAHVRTRQWFRNGETLVWSDGQANKRTEYAAPRTRRTVSRLS